MPDSQFDAAPDSLRPVRVLRASDAFRWPGGKRAAMIFNIAFEAWSDGVAPPIGPMGNVLKPGHFDTNALSWADYGVNPYGNSFIVNDGFLEFDGQILARMGDIAHVPGDIVQGRYDMICPPGTAWALAEAWPQGRLRMVPLAGHALSEPGISAELVRITNALRSEARALDL